MRVFLEATELAKTYRNYVQHLRGKLCGEPPNNSPVWGSLAWVDDTDPLVSYLVNFGARLPGMEYLSCVYDTAEKRWVSRVSLGLDQASFNFDPVFESARRFEDFVMPHLHEQIGEAAEYQEQLPIIKFRAAESTN